MSAESIVEAIIDRAVAIGDAKSQAADQYAQAAVTASQGSVGLNYTPFAFAPGNVEPLVHIPQTATGLDTALFDSTYQRIFDDLTNQFADFFSEYFPNECNSLGAAQEWLCKVLTEGGTGIRPHIEEQIWQRERSRTLREASRASEEVMTTFASRGFPLPPGAAQHQVSLVQQRLLEQNAEASRTRAIQQAELEIQNIRFAVEQALDYRVKGIQAAAEYIRTLALGPQIAMQLATSASDAQARLITAASSYYNARIRLEEIKLDVQKTNTAFNLDAGKTSVGAFVDLLRTRANTITAVSQSLGTQAGSALNAMHASAGIAVQGEVG